MKIEAVARLIAPDVSGLTLAQLYNMSGRVAVVTGGSRGLGLAIAERLAEAGAHVVLADIAQERAIQAAQAITEKGRYASAVGMDVRSRSSVDDAFATIAAARGGIDILVNNAGLLSPTPHVAEMDDALWQTAFEVNVNGVMRACRAAIPYLSRSNVGGVIVNMSSTAAFRAPNPGTSAYTATKHAVDAINKVLAMELGPRGIRVNAVAPTAVETPGMEELREATKHREMPLGNTARFNEILLLGRIAVPDDVARGVLFLASDMAKLITGTTLAIDAGSMVVR